VPVFNIRALVIHTVGFSLKNTSPQLKDLNWIKVCEFKFVLDGWVKHFFLVTANEPWRLVWPGSGGKKLLGYQLLIWIEKNYNQAEATSHSIPAALKYPLLVFNKKYHNKKQIVSPLQLGLNPKCSWVWRTCFNWFQGALFGGWGVIERAILLPSHSGFSKLQEYRVFYRY